VATGFSPSIPRIVISKETSVPFVCGILRPTIVLPRQRQGANLHDVLAHEIAHVISDDTRHNAMQAALAVIWWWNPIYWWLAAELRRVREERCDDFVLAAGLSSAWQYSRSIVDVAEGAPALAWVGMASPVHALEPRLRRLADTRIVRSVRLTPFEIAAVVVVAAVLTPGLHLSF
jgi:beta-lactamase regulating signal transducer with metallopeptidase domain